MVKFNRSVVAVGGMLAFAPFVWAQAPTPKPAPPAPAPAPAPPAQPSGIETAILVLDASGSMNDPVGGQPKIAIAKQAVHQLLNGWDSSVPLGLTVYGGATGSCSDIRSLIPVAPTPPPVFMDAVNSLQAKGSTPLTDAVIQAAEQLDYENNQATVILVSDGLESCGGDPCAMATSLEQMGVDLTVHVVGFAVTADQAEAGLSCIAKNTGGQYETASDAASLNAALTTMVQDVKTRKKAWRKRLGKHWGKNGRWKKGRWKVGKGDGHKKMWAQKRAGWHKKGKHAGRAKKK